MDIAIVGMSCRLPGGANDVQKLWDMLEEGRSAWSKVPKDRFNSEAFYHPDPDVNGSVNTQSGHFLDHDVSTFDAPFFGISPSEAQTMDPQQRVLLESAYEALENAGIPLQDVAGSKTAVYAAIFSRDYLSILSKDTADMGKYYMTGVGDAILANRVSYLFDLKGPSVTLDTGCSGSLVAIHLASQSLRTGESDLAIASGVNLILHPDQMIPMSLMHILNNDGKCYTFDSRGSGYGRGEGAGTLILKRLDDAISAGDNIRAVIRASGVNSDGKTSGIALPNQLAQEDLARAVYESAGLDPTQTPYIEAHGTGTEAGDVIELNGIANVFTKQKRHSPLYVGSIKANVGHLEAVSGIAGVLKAVLVLEKGKIPPQLNLKEFKKDLPLTGPNLKIALGLEDFPADTIRRASVASFGYGGTNSHLILEQFSPSRSKYLQVPRAYPIPRLLNDSVNGSSNAMRNGVPNGHANGHAQKPAKTHLTGLTNGHTPAAKHYFLPLSARSEYSLNEMKKDLAEWTSANPLCLEDLEYTLSTRRSKWQWRTSAVVSSATNLTEAFKSAAMKPHRVSSATRIMFLFTGQGAQWYAMGRELFATSTIFAKSIAKSGMILQSLGASWDLREEMSRDESSSKINQGVIGQPACTALQIALVDHLASLNILPDAVMGHSSGEIAAAYAVGALTQETAMTVSYHRSFLSRRSQEVVEHPGSMAVLGMSADEAAAECVKLESGLASVACLNDPQSTTVSGDEVAIDELIANLDPSIFKRKLKVDAAYHSYHMEAVAQEYLYSMYGLKTTSKIPEVQFVSSVTANIKGDDFGPAYWVDNLVSPVRFSDALQNYCRKQYAIAQATLSPVSHIFLEIGPHSALAGPCKRTVQSLNLDSFSFTYVSALVRGVEADRSVLESVARLFDQGAAVDLAAATASPGARPHVIGNLPGYAWDKRTSYWHESRLSREHRNRRHAPHDLLGVRAVGDNPQEPAWRHILSLDALPWLKDHIIDGEITFPGTGYITMAVEAVRQLGSDLHWPSAKQYHVRDIEFTKTLIIPESPKSVEAVIRLHRPRNPSDRSTSGWYSFQISSIQDGATWNDHCTGMVMIEFELNDGAIQPEDAFETSKAVKGLEQAKNQCTNAASPEEFYRDLDNFGNRYGSKFAVLEDLSIGDDIVVATIKTPDVAACMPSRVQREHVIHPATIDAMLHMQIPLFMQHGGSSSVVPTRIEHVIISARTATGAGDALFCYGQLTYQGSRTADAEAVALQLDANGNHHQVVKLSGGELRAIGEDRETQDEEQDNEHVSTLLWAEHVDFLDQKVLQTPESRLEPPVGSLTLEEKEDLFTELTTWYINKALRKIRENNLSIPETYEKWYYAWMQRYNQSDSAQAILKALTDERLAARLRILEGMGVEGETLKRLGESLTDIATGQVSSLDVFLQGDLYYRMYSVDPSLQCAKYLSEYIKHLYHERGPLRVLEVGAGTGTTTKTLFEDMRRAGIMPFRRYDFTDISSGFFEQAENAFSQYPGLMNFKMFNAENSPKAQGFDEGAYDLVIGANVIHATRKLNETLDNVRTLLTPGGRLAMIEVTRVTPAYNAAFGAIPGWWNGVEDGREDTPLLSIEKWNERLLGSSFSGVNIALRDSDSPAWMSTLMVSQAPWRMSPDKANVQIILTPYLDEATISLATELKQKLSQRGHAVSSVSLSSKIDDSAVQVLFDSGSKPLLVDPSSSDFESIRLITSKSQNVFWITAQGNSEDVQKPEKAFSTGFSRSARSENPRLRMTMLDVQQDVTFSREKIVDIAFDIFERSFCSEDTLPSENFEFAIRDNRVYIPRVAINSKLSQLTNGSKTTLKADEEMLFHQPQRPLRLHVEKPGLLDTLMFVDDETKQAPLPDDQVEIQVMACGINFKDVFIALGQMKPTVRMVGECAGVISAVGKDWVHEFKVGDRVCAYNGTSYSSLTRVSGYTANHIPEYISFDTAASIPVVFATAHRSLIDVANLQKNESVLIHAGAGGVGQAAIIIAQHIGAQVFTTVGSESKRQMLIDRYGIPPDHIFSSRDRSFKAGVLRLTQEHGVNVVLNSLSGEALQDSWACLAKFGTFVEIGKADIYRKSLISMQPFDKNVTFTSVDLTAMADFRPKIMKTLLNEVIERFADGRYSSVFPITVMKLGEIESAFRLIQSRKHTGKIVLTADEKVLVRATAPRIQEVQLEPEGTYVISGGFGGVGKNLIRYMTAHGARSFVILTRRSITREQKRELDQELSGPANVKVLQCDVSNIDALRTAVDKIRHTMPPVRGVVQAAVTLVDRVVETMTLDDWQKCLQPKYVGSRNLVDAFKDVKLDFFLMLSSCAVVAGTRGQTNYNAGNAYQGALSHCSSSSGTYYCTLDLSLVKDSRYGSRREVMLSLLRQGCIPSTPDEYLRLCGYMMSPAMRKDGLHHISMGFNRTSLSGKDDLFTLKSSLFNLFPYPKQHDVSIGGGGDKRKNVEALLASATSLEEIQEIVSDAIVQKMGALVANDDIDLDSPIADLGVDSLIAIELKNWFNRIFKAAIQTSEIFESPTLRTLAARVLEKADLRPKEGSSELDGEIDRTPTQKAEVGLSKPNGISANGTAQDEVKIVTSPANGSTHRTESATATATTTANDDNLLTLPVPTLDDSFNSFLETARAFGSDEDIRRVKVAIEDFKKVGSVGQKLQARLREKADDPNTKNWLGDVYAASLWLQPRIPVRPISTFFISHVLSDWQHSQAERAALISLTAFQYKQDMDRGTLEVEHFNEQPQCMNTHRWLFNTYRRPAIPMDIPEKHPGNDFVAVLRQGHLFKVDLARDGRTTSFNGLRETFQSIIDEPLDGYSWASVLTTDERTSWAQVRDIVARSNPAYLDVLEKSLFIVSLDEGSPNSASERARCWVLDDNINRWNDKMLHLIVMSNGVSATYGEHSMMDGPTTNQLNRRIEAAIRNHKREAAPDGVMPGSTPLPLQHMPFTSNYEINSAIDRCRITWKKSIAQAAYDSFTLTTYGSAYLQAHRISAKSAFQIMIQMAAHTVFGRSIPSWDPVLMRHFRHGRLELIQVVTPVVASFCASASNTSIPVATRKKAFIDAVASYTNGITRAAQGKGWARHMHALRFVVRDGEQMPALFEDPLYTQTGPGRLITSYTAISGDPEIGIIWNDPEVYYVHFEPHENVCRLDISHGSGRLDVFWKAFVEASEVVRALLGPAPVRS